MESSHWIDYPITWIIAAVVLLMIASIGYFRLFKKYKDAFEFSGKKKVVFHTFSFIPVQDAPAWPHITFGIILLLGLSILVSCGLAFVFIVETKDYSKHITGYIGLSFTILISCISFYTLWQTKRIEHKVGDRIEGFGNLIKKITDELIELIESHLEDEHRRVSEYHRFLLLTSNPFLGIISYPNSITTERYKNKIQNLINYTCPNNDFNLKSGFLFKIICADEEGIINFNNSYFQDKKSNEIELKRVQNSTAEFFQMFEDKKKLNIIKRVPEIAPAQFLIIDDALYEFTFKKGNAHSQLIYADVKRDRGLCDRYLETFELYFKKL